MTHAALLNALALFGLEPPVTYGRIRERHRELALAHHPDRSPFGDPEAMARINAAYEILSRYCGEFRFAFTEEEFLEQNPEERLRRQFAAGALWGES